MAGIPFTLRIEPAENTALKNLSKVEGRPINQLLNEAIKSYLRRKGDSETAWEKTLEELRKYRQKKNAFRRAVASLVEAETTLDDPLESGLTVGKFDKGRFKPTAGSAQIKVRKLLGA